MFSLRKVKTFGMLWTTFVRNKSRLPVKSKPISFRTSQLPDSDIENVDTEYLEEVLEDEIHAETTRFLPNMSRHFRKREEEQQARQILKEQILFRKSLPKEPNLLTWAARSQIKQLNHQHPDEWTPEKLADHFPVTKHTIKKVLNSKLAFRSVEEIMKFDARVHRNWLAVQKSIESYAKGMPVDPAHEFLLANKKLQLMVNAAGVSGKPCPNVEDLVRPSPIAIDRQSRKAGQFLSIIQSYNKQLDAKNKSEKLADVEAKSGYSLTDPETVKLLREISKGKKSEKSDDELKKSRHDDDDDDKVHRVRPTPSTVRHEKDTTRNAQHQRYMNNNREYSSFRKNESRDKRNRSINQERPRYPNRTSATEVYQDQCGGRKNKLQHTDYSSDQGNSYVKHRDHNEMNRRTKRYETQSDDDDMNNNREYSSFRENESRDKRNRSINQERPRYPNRTSATEVYQDQYGGRKKKLQHTDYRYSSDQGNSYVKHRDHNEINRRTKHEKQSDAEYQLHYDENMDEHDDTVCDLEYIKMIPKHQLKIQGKGFSNGAREVYDQSGELLYRVP